MTRLPETRRHDARQAGAPSLAPIWALALALALALVLTAACAPTAVVVPSTPAPTPAAAALDTVRSDPLDAGRFWTFEYAPKEYFSETYAFTADSAWFAHARLAAVRLPGCSAAFVSEHGLVVTNHHCVRGSITAVTREGESLLDDGFFARTMADERRVPNNYVDQLVAIEDVSDEVFAAQEGVTDDAARAGAVRAAAERVRERLGAAHARGGVDTHVEVIPLYNGGRYSAYVFHRYRDVRLVAAPELLLGYFGGDPDNFTYPRYALDFAFYRVYDEAGQPLRPSHHFTMSATGVSEGEPVFAIGSPGRTNRLLTMAQLEFQRDVEVAAALDFLDSRLVPMNQLLASDPVLAERINLRNRAFGLANRQKGTAGRMAALQDPIIMARKADAERILRAEIQTRPEVARRWGGVIDQLAALQAEKRALAGEHAAYHRLGDPSAGSRIMVRALLAAELEAARAAGAPADTLRARAARLLAVGDHPAQLECGLLELRLRDVERWLGAGHPVTAAALGGRPYHEAAPALLAASVLGDSARLARALTPGARLPADDPGVALGMRLAHDVARYQVAWGALMIREGRLNEDMGRARFEVYGTALPPDATRSPRISDGVVAGYPYNGTMAPAYTTFFGMYDRFHAFGPGSDWDLHERWRTPPPALPLGTPLNFVSTADTFSGSSGSPVVTRGLELVGLNFDRNVEGLVRDWIYLPHLGRNVMVDVRAIRATLEHVYGMGHLVEELDGRARPR
jgi:hypothetical protein